MEKDTLAIERLKIAYANERVYARETQVWFLGGVIILIAGLVATTYLYYQLERGYEFLLLFPGSLLIGIGGVKIRHLAIISHKKVAEATEDRLNIKKKLEIRTSEEVMSPKEKYWKNQPTIDIYQKFDLTVASIKTMEDALTAIIVVSGFLTATIAITTIAIWLTPYFD